MVIDSIQGIPRITNGYLIRNPPIQKKISFSEHIYITKLYRSRTRSDGQYKNDAVKR